MGLSFRVRLKVVSGLYIDVSSADPVAGGRTGCNIRR